MKSIYSKDIKAITKKFDLSEDESEQLKYIAESINQERTPICYDVQSVLLRGTSFDDVRVAIISLLLYFGNKVQKENDIRFHLDLTTWKLSEILKCSAYHIGLWFQGSPLWEKRFRKFVECSDTFGLNYLEITL